MDVSEFDFDLPEELIALRPASPRDSARMLVVHGNGTLEHAHVRDLPRFLRAGDALVVNDSKVIAARLFGRRGARAGTETGAKIELLLHRRLAPDRFLALARPARRLAAGDVLQLGRSIEASVAAPREGAEVELLFVLSGTALDEAIEREGEMPLPPYIAGRRPTDASDTADYQTVFAHNAGSVAAPTAGLHFTPELLNDFERAGVVRQSVTLHVGLGTFLPVTAADINAHRMHPEWASVSAETAERLNAVRGAGGRVVATGTTALRTLETAASDDGLLSQFTGETDIFITPGYRFKAVDVLLTNFHLPRSTLFMLVCAFSGMETMRAAYAEAMRERYRFYSYGDACLLLPKP